MHDRAIISVSGPDRLDFLQDLITNDIAKMKAGLTYSALLTPQGKYLFDFFLFERDGAVLLDADRGRAEDLARMLGFYRLRRSVEIAPIEMPVAIGIKDLPSGAAIDPRNPNLGWRHYGVSNLPAQKIDWDSVRVEHCIPAAGIELIPNSTFILEAGFERLNGVDFRKGCYVGQEVTARMKHKAELARRLTTVSIEGNAPCGTELLAGGRKVGTLLTQSGNKALAYLRLGRIGDSPIFAGQSRVRTLAH